MTPYLRKRASPVPEPGRDQQQRWSQRWLWQLQGFERRVLLELGRGLVVLHLTESLLQLPLTALLQSSTLPVSAWALGVTSISDHRWLTTISWPPTLEVMRTKKSLSWMLQSPIILSSERILPE